MFACEAKDQGSIPEDTLGKKLAVKSSSSSVRKLQLLLTSAADYMET
jgi:hypothetical protein